MKIGPFVLVAMFLLAPVQGIAQIQPTNLTKMAAACNIKTAKNCFEWCQKQGKVGRYQEECTRVCQKRRPGC
jgi:hypothetical protein